MTVKDITIISDHADLAIGRLTQIYKDPVKKYSVLWSPDLKSGWEVMIHAFAIPSQSLEDIMGEMLADRGLDTAGGVNLDRIGQIVGSDRDGNTDEDYRIIIAAQIAGNNSDGTARDLLGITQVLMADEFINSSIKELFPAKVVIDIGVELPLVEPNNTARVLSGLLEAKLAGVDIDVELVVDDNYFAFDSDTSVGANGFSTTDNPSTGGNYTNIIS
jgi:hypothetical protein